MNGSVNSSVKLIKKVLYYRSMDTNDKNNNDIVSKLQRLADIAIDKALSRPTNANITTAMKTLETFHSYLSNNTNTNIELTSKLKEMLKIIAEEEIK